MGAFMKKNKDLRRGDDETLFGLLSSYKLCISYLYLYLSEKEDSVVLFLADNPKRTSVMGDERYAGFRPMKRLEMGVAKLSIKYLQPQHIIKSMGPLLGMKIPSNKVTIVNNIDNEGYFILETSLRYLDEVLQNVRRIINLNPQKKYEILEKFLTENT
jgi:hypothetical protein